jgi:2-polyprenyl-3-methyl-5-hydroxy-6-metoxy-1,4-benzoquinol methylase
MPSCLVCDGDCRPLREVDGYDFVHCSGCGLIQIDAETMRRIDAGEPVLTYAESYWADEMKSAREHAYTVALSRAAEVFLLSRRPIARFLDVGSGPGLFLDAIATHLPHLSDRFHAVEMFPPETAQRTRHANYLVGRVSDYPAETFDGGICVEVFEHLTPRMVDGLLGEIASISRNGACFLINTGLADYTIGECPEYLDPLGRGHITSWTVAAVNHLARPHGLVASAIPGRSWCFLLEKADRASGDAVFERKPLPENLAALGHPGIGTSPIAMLGEIALLQSHYYDQFVSRSHWAMALDGEVSAARSSNQQLRVENERLQNAVSARDAKLDAARDQLRSETDALRNEVARRDARIHAMLTSRSWRMTAGVRRISTAVRRWQQFDTSASSPPRPAMAAIGPTLEPAPAIYVGPPAIASQPPPGLQPDVWARLRSHADWAALAGQHPDGVSPRSAAQIVAHALSHGVSSRFLGDVPAAEVAMTGGDIRENFIARGLNARQRAVLEVLAGHERAHDIHAARIYAHEGVTPLALLMRGRYPYFVGSEYAADPEAAARIWPVPAVDITCSSFADGAFDFVLSNEVLEHVPDLDAALRDTARILKPAGRLIATFPFGCNSDTTLVRARLVDGKVEHLLPAEFHGNPVDPQGGSLVFQVPGWDVLDRCRRAGFSDAWITYVSSGRAGIAGHDTAGIMVLEAER